jgi:hypothetical protein
MRSAIGGVVDYSVLSQVHRPREEEAMARAVRELAARGLAARDIGEHLRLDPTAVRRLLLIGRAREIASNC